MCPFNPRLNFRVTYCLKLAIAVHESDESNKMTTEITKVVNNCVYPHRYRKLIKPSRPRLIKRWKALSTG